jgi:hypothetical protein
VSHTFYLNPTPQTVHWGHFNASIPAVLQVESGDEVVIDTFSGGMSEVADPSLFRPEHRLIVDTVPQIMGPHILTGPVHVKGAEPGDTLEVRINVNAKTYSLEKRSVKLSDFPFTIILSFLDSLFNNLIFDAIFCSTLFKRLIFSYTISS